MILKIFLSPSIYIYKSGGEPCSANFSFTIHQTAKNVNDFDLLQPLKRVLSEWLGKEGASALWREEKKDEIGEKDRDEKITNNDLCRHRCFSVTEFERRFGDIHRSPELYWTAASSALWQQNPKVQHSSYRSPILDTILSRILPLHIFYRKIHLRVTVSDPSRSSKWTLSWRFSSA